MISRVIEEEAELDAVARGLLSELEKSGRHILALRGDLGAGKTALTKALARVLDIEGDITSPTFVIMKSYPIKEHPRFKTLVHMDAYRIEDTDELRVLGLKELEQNPENLLVIEWPERIQESLTEDILTVTLAITEGTHRHITYGSSS